MNKDRRKALAEIAEELGGLKGRLEELQSEERDYYDNMTENMRAGEKGELVGETRRTRVLRAIRRDIKMIRRWWAS